MHPRDFIGYGRNPPDPRWPAGARLAVNFVVNIEEGAEPSIDDGDGYTEAGLTEVPASPVPRGQRDLAAESMFEYGSRVGFWRLYRLFEERALPVTGFACALALERNPEIAAAVAASGWDLCAHGLRWVEHFRLEEADERAQIAAAARRIEAATGIAPAGWYCRYGPGPNTRRLIIEHGGFEYDSDAYNDELPYWVEIAGRTHLVVPYSLYSNDTKFPRLAVGTGSEFFRVPARDLRRALRGGSAAPAHDVGGAAQPGRRAPRTQCRPRPFPGLPEPASRRVDRASPGHRPALAGTSRLRAGGGGRPEACRGARCRPNPAVAGSQGGSTPGGEVAMRLNEQNVADYAERGWIVVPDVFRPAECDVLEAAAFQVLERPGPEVSRETDGSPHVCWGMHLFDERLATLARHPAVVGPAEQLLGQQVFVHQSRINIKQTGGSIVEWHQDFGTYHRVDGVPEPRGIMIAVFLDDVNECNAPVLAIPGSHREGIVSSARIDPTVSDHDTTSKYRYDIWPDTMKDLVERLGIEAITAKRGAMLFMNATVVHGSSVNITPLRRLLLYINVSPTDNRGETYARPEYYAARDFSPLVPLAEDCLLAYRAGA